MFYKWLSYKSNLIQDPMHNLSEGINYYLLALFLHRCIIEYNFFTLDWLNEEIQSYSFTGNGLGHVSKIITRHQLVNEVYIKQKPTAMTTLMFCLHSKIMTHITTISYFCSELIRFASVHTQLWKHVQS